jgi:hypothetical protein
MALVGIKKILIWTKKEGTPKRPLGVVTLKVALMEGADLAEFLSAFGGGFGPRRSG